VTNQTRLLERGDVLLNTQHVEQQAIRPPSIEHLSARLSFVVR
jgi:hypothetical protein